MISVSVYFLGIIAAQNGDGELRVSRRRERCVRIQRKIIQMLTIDEREEARSFRS